VELALGEVGDGVVDLLGELEELVHRGLRVLRQRAFHGFQDLPVNLRHREETPLGWIPFVRRCMEGMAGIPRP